MGDSLQGVIELFRDKKELSARLGVKEQADYSIGAV